MMRGYFLPDENSVEVLFPLHLVPTESKTRMRPELISVEFVEPVSMESGMVMRRVLISEVDVE